METNNAYTLKFDPVCPISEGYCDYTATGQGQVMHIAGAERAEDRREHLHQLGARISRLFEAGAHPFQLWSSMITCAKAHALLRILLHASPHLGLAPPGTSLEGLLSIFHEPLQVSLVTHSQLAVTRMPKGFGSAWSVWRGHKQWEQSISNQCVQGVSCMQSFLLKQTACKRMRS